MRRPVTEVIDGFSVAVVPLSPRETFRNMGRLMAIVSPVAGGVSGGPLSGNGSIADTKIDLGKLTDVCLAQYREADWLLDTFLDGAKVDSLPMEAAMEKFTSAMTLPKCLAFALKVNYADIFDALQGALGGALKGLMPQPSPSAE